MLPRVRPNILRLLAGGTLVALLGLTGCGRDRSPPRAETKPPPVVLGSEHRFTLTVGDQAVQLRLAVHESERQRGLMNVSSMPEDEGMLFVWADPQQMSFFMRNTKLPLDIGFFDDRGTLREIYAMYPGVEDSVRSRSSQLRFALEMNQGWFARHQVKPGAQLDLRALGEALRQRGYDPAKYVGVAAAR